MVSKVAVALCAMMVLAVVGQAAEFDSTAPLREALENIQANLCELVEQMCVAGGEVEVFWNVPTLPAGGIVAVSVDHNLVKVSSEGLQVVDEPPCGLRTWSYHGEGLNDSMLEELDVRSPSLRAKSGEHLLIKSCMVLLNEDAANMVFISLRGSALLGESR